MGPSEEDAEELVREMRGGRGRRKSQFEDFVDLNNLIPVLTHMVMVFLHSFFRQTTMRIGIVCFWPFNWEFSIRGWARIARNSDDSIGL
jgi:hypothetical protein